MYPPQRGGVRATTIHDLVPLRFPEWVHGPHAADARREVPERGAHLRPRLRELGVHRARRRRAARRARGSRARRAARSRRGLRARRRARRARRPYVLTVATLEPRKNLETLVERARAARPRRPRARGRRRGGLGRAAGARPARRRQARLRRRRRARPPVPRRRRVRLPVAVRGLRHPGDRGDGLRRARRLLVARVDGRGVRRRGRARRSREPGRDRRGDREALDRRDELVSRGLAHAARFSWSRTGRVFLDAYVRGCADDARRPRRLAARPDARRHGALHRGHRRARRRRARSPLPSRRRPRSRPSSATRGGTRSTLPRLAKRERLDVLHCPTFRGPISPPPMPLVVTVHDLAVLRHPETFNQWTRRYSRSCVPRVARAASR